MSGTGDSGQWPVASGQCKTLVLLDDKPGHANQALGVAEKLGLPFKTIKLEYSIFAKLPNVLLGRSLLGLVRSSQFAVRSALGSDLLVISCGRRTAPVARWLKKEACKLVHIMNPESGYQEFDLIALPAHDNALESANIFRTVVAPHRLTTEKLTEEAGKWKSEFDKLKKPIIGVLVGGGTKRGQFSKSEIEKFKNLLCGLAERSGGSLFVVTSRRTGKQAEKWLADAVAIGNFYPYSETTPNPYLATIALADALVVTGDSVSMVSEACYSGKLVFVYSELAAVSTKHKEFLQNLYRLDMIQPLGETSKAAVCATATPTNDSAKSLADEIRKRFLGLPKA